jgi:hypothetical protein
MNLDLRTNGILSVECAKLLTELEPKSRIIYNKYIDNLSSDNKLTGLSLLLQPTNRNTTNSAIHSTLCKYNLVRHLLQENKLIDKVFVNSKYDKEILNSIFNSYNKTANIIYSEKIGIYLIILNNLVKSLYFLLVNVFLSIILGLKDFKRPSGSIIYIDTFMSVSSITDCSIFNERYYRGLEDTIDSLKLNKLWYAPVPVGFDSISDFYTIYKFIRKSDSNILHQNNYLKPYDYLKALYLSFKLIGNVNTYPRWLGHDISSLINREIKTELFSTQLFIAVLRYFFIKRIAESGVKIDIVINWNENQVIDRALCLGIRDYYPGVKIKGYQGLTPSKYYASLEPTCFEVKSKTVPDVILAIGSAFVEYKKINCKDVNVGIAPAYRFSHLHEINRKISFNNNVIFVALPYYMDECIRILYICLSIVNTLEPNYKVKIKLHPDHVEGLFNKNLPHNLTNQFSFTTLTISELLATASYLFSSASSTCIEAAVLGIPVAIMGNLSGPTQNPLVDLIDADKWSIIYSSEDFIYFIDSMIIMEPLDISTFFKKASYEESNVFLSDTC